MKILLTGGAGYIGSHTAIELISLGHEVVIVDNLANSSEKVLDRIEQIIGKKPKFYKADCCDKEAMEKLFSENELDAVIHFAGLKAVGESCRMPIEYYKNNIDSTLVLLEVMRAHGVKNIIFSSSATVYGAPDCVPIKETAVVGRCTNPYGWTKYMNEVILTDATKADPELSVVLLRYFNPVGAHVSGLIGESPNGIPNNLMPYISQVAVGKLAQLSVYGNDYDTHDGTGVRDYIHVVDLAKGHACAVDYVVKHKGTEVFNLGTGVGYSVLDMVKAFEDANGVKVPYRITDRRPGDIAECYADSTKAKELMGWTAEKTLVDMCGDSWRWQKNNPNGYND
ncbi:MAG: UDP-glucose 4-epimerase GalE [Ruminococcaceae bacterium]|nr:UDP-glucose 4-epimerase GalE [Oscillospiraceae bacterium]